MTLKQAALLAVLALSAAPISALAAQPPRLSPEAARGRDLFLRHGCSNCHGTVGQGGASGPRIAPDARPLDYVRGYLRNPLGEMPPFTDTLLSDAEIADIHAYLSSIPKPPDLTKLQASK